MKKIQLSRIIRKDENLAMINEMCNSLGCQIFITEDNEEIFKYNCMDNTNLQKLEVENCLPNVQIWGDGKSTTVVRLLDFLIGNAKDIKSILTDVINKYKELSIFYTLGEKIAACSDVRHIARITYDEVLKFIDATDMMLILKGENSDKVDTVINLPCEKNKPIIDPNSKLLNEVMAGMEAQIFNGLEQSNKLEEYKIKSKCLMCVPIVIKNVAEGIAIIGHREKNMYTSEDLKIFNAAIFQLILGVENAKLYNILEDTFLQTVSALSETIEKRDPYTGGHTHRVMNYALAIGIEMELSRTELVSLRLAALMHDIGKIGIEDKILRKEGALTEEEYELMKVHPKLGADILNNMKYLSTIVKGVISHHEKYDGTGYPNKLKGEEIHSIGRILAVADSFDAMISDRPYRKGLKVEKALAELNKHSGTQFDPKVIDAFNRAYQKGYIQV